MTAIQQGMLYSFFRLITRCLSLSLSLSSPYHSLLLYYSSYCVRPFCSLFLCFKSLLFLKVCELPLLCIRALALIHVHIYLYIYRESERYVEGMVGKAPPGHVDVSYLLY